MMQLKKIIKRHIELDIISLPHSISLTKANVRKKVLNIFSFILL